MKVNMSKTQFKELLEEYISNLEKDYDSNQTGNSIHPTYSLIQSTYQKIEDVYSGIIDPSYRVIDPIVKTSPTTSQS